MTKKELKMLIESIVESELQSEDRTRRESHPLFSPDNALSKDELNAALQKQRDKKLRMDAQRKRSAIKNDLREEEELCEDYGGRTDEAKQLLLELLPEVSSILEKSKQLETLLAGTPGTENIRGAVEYHSEQLSAALDALKKRVR